MQVLLIVAPVFALITLGYAASMTGVLSAAAHKGISEFAFSIAMPTLLFRTIIVTQVPEIEPLQLWGAYFGACIATWILATLIATYMLRRSPPDAASIAMGSVYGNTVMIGIPLCLAAFGDAAAAPMALILSINAPVLWIIGTLHMEWAERKEGTSFLHLLTSLLSELARNPLMIAIVAGTLWRWTGIGLHPAADKVLLMLAQSGVPCALVSLGASLINFRVKGQAPTLLTLCLLKVVAMPAIAWALAFWVFKLPLVPAGVVVLFCAMPAGANVFIYATRYQRVVNSASGAVALGTLLSAASAVVLITALI